MIIICRDILHYTFFECKQDDLEVFFHQILRIKGTGYICIDFIAIPGRRKNLGLYIYIMLCMKDENVFRNLKIF